MPGELTGETGLCRVNLCPVKHGILSLKDPRAVLTDSRRYDSSEGQTRLQGSGGSVAPHGRDERTKLSTYRVT